MLNKSRVHVKVTTANLTRLLPCSQADDFLLLKFLFQFQTSVILLRNWSPGINTNFNKVIQNRKPLQEDATPNTVPVPLAEHAVLSLIIIQLSVL